LFGHSRGGGTAILQAARDTDVRALVTWAAISSTNRWAPELIADWRQSGYIPITNARTGDVIPLSIEILHEVEEFGETKLNIAKSAAEIKSPWLIVHGSDDESVPVAEGERLSSLAGTNGEFLRLDGVNHSFGGKHPLTQMTDTLESITRKTVEFFTRHLAKA
jgi:dipeptidyl aminopeptidase/acylaminoacyl peptidase